MNDVKNFRIEGMLKVAEDDQSPSGTIYHYTTMDSALKILASGRFWFTERTYLNDPSEIFHSIDNMRKLLNPYSNLTEAFDFFVKDEMEKSLFFIASFSLKPDDLSLWRCYADNGRGLALGIELKEFPKCPEVNNFTRHRHRVLYDANKFMSNIDLIAEKALSLYNTCPSRLRKLAQDLSKIAVFGGIMNKNEAYKSESEFRFAYWTGTDLPSKHCHNGVDECLHREVRTKNGEFIQYLDVPIPQWTSGTLKHIQIGPAAADGTEKALRVVCVQHCIPLPLIDRSVIPYRS